MCVSLPFPRRTSVENADKPPQIQAQFVVLTERNKTTSQDCLKPCSLFGRTFGMLSISWVKMQISAK